MGFNSALKGLIYREIWNHPQRFCSSSTGTSPSRVPR